MIVTWLATVFGAATFGLTIAFVVVTDKRRSRNAPTKTIAWALLVCALITLALLIARFFI
jgi:hypothetical protein